MGEAEFLSRTPLFAGSSPEEVSAMLGCLDARKRSYEQGARIHRMGDVIKTVGLVLEGSVRIESVDVWGNVSVVGVRGPGGMFGEAYAAVPGEPLLVDVVAAQDCAVLFLNLGKVLATCSHACAHHARASRNMTAMIARQTLALSRRIFHVAPKTIRGKVLAYLSDEAERAGAREFDIPFDRQQLADYLGVDRSALSAELSRMRKAGILETRRSHFVLF
ncbi:MAG: Crp/Fnr family transcriptional regulator [Coriobacteriaceae bacterium]|nr:Crp/Fnr family transcriptional regulator [Coriobacteriaceae bacterium]